MHIIATVIYLIAILIISAMAIVGWFLATRGEEIVMPDGTIKREGKVFMNWYFFWHKERAEKIRVYYTGDQLKKMAEKAMAVLNSHNLIVPNKNGVIDTLYLASSKEKIIDFFEHSMNVKTQLLSPDGSYIQLYQEYENYVFPEWIRDMMAGCVTCHATFYGNMIWWAMVAMVPRETLYNDLLGFTEYKVAGFIGVWFLFWLSLAWLNTVFYLMTKRK